MTIGEGVVPPRAGPTPSNDQRMGVLAALGAYGMWGFFPVLFHLLIGIGPIAIIAHRIVWSFLLVGAILSGRGRLGEVRAALSSAAALRGIAISAALLSVNWLVYVWAVENQKVLETSFGYFINPLVSVAIGMVFLGERMNRLQWIAIAIAILAIAIQAVGLSGLPLVSLALAFSFGFYGYIRKTVSVGSAPGLFIETMMLLPLALGYLGFTLATEGPGLQADPKMFALLVLTGPATSFALIFFAYAARRLRLSTIGMFQYLAPSMHFAIAIWAFGEPLNMVQLLSFVLIWVSIAIYSYDSYRQGAAKRVAARG